MSDAPHQVRKNPPYDKRGRLSHILDFLGRIAKRSDDVNIGLISAGVAFFGLFATFPAIAAVIAIFGLWADPLAVREQFVLLHDVIPPQAYDLFRVQIDTLLEAGTQKLTWATILSISIALWSARAGVAAMIRGLNAAYGTPNRGGLRHIAVAMMLTAVLILVVVFLLMAVIVAPLVIAAVNRVVPIPGSTAWILETIRWAVALTMMILGLGILYRYGPNRRGNRPKWITPGALMVIVAWFVASIGFSTYLSNFNRFNEVYGSIGAVIAVQMWMFISAYLVILGALVNVELPPRGLPEADLTAS